MKKIFTLLACVSLSFGVSAQTVFESDLSTWAAGDPVDWMGSVTSIPSTDVIEQTVGVTYGTSLAQLINTSSTHVRFTTIDIAVTPGETYEITMYVAALNGDLRTNYYDVTNAAYGTYNPYFDLSVESGGTLVALSQTVTVPGTCSDMQVILSLRNTDGFGIAVAQPQRIAGFIIGNTFAWPLRKPVFRVFSFLMGSFPGPMIAHSFNGIVKFFFRRGIRKHALNKAEWNMYLAPFKTVESRAPTHIFPKALAHSSIFLAGLENKMSILSEKPALFLWGDKDFAFGPDERKRLMKSFPLNQVVHLKGAGHFIQEDAPEEIASAIHGWLRNK